MKNFILLLSLVALTAHLQAEEEGCKKCQIIREYNATHPQNNPYYYEDYLKEQNQKQAAPAAPEKTESKLVCDEGEMKKPQAADLLASCGTCGGVKKPKPTILAGCGCGGETKKPEPKLLAGCGCGGETKKPEPKVLVSCGTCGGIKKPKPEAALACSACDSKGSDKGSDRGGSKDRDRKKDRGLILA